MKHDKSILTALVLTASLGLTAGPAWSQADKQPGDSSSDKFKPRPEISQPSEQPSGMSTQSQPGATSSKESGMPSRMRGPRSAGTAVQCGGRRSPTGISGEDR